MASSSPPPKLPIPGGRNILITSALPYVNNVPHLGNIIGCVLSADVFARYCRLRGYNAIYICGTDEYGTATETKAMEEKCTPKEICDKYHKIHDEVYKWFDIKFDKFGRTSSPEQTEVCHAIFHKLMENNWLTENTMQQLYCDTCQRFLADRLVEGICPNRTCNAPARGDQCEICSTMLNPTELIEPKCKVCKNTPRIRDTDHLFLELPQLRDKLVDYISDTSVTGMWSQNAIQATNAWLKEGLKPRCITRDLKWGVPVPHEKYKDKVFYVWFDAPIGYVSITAGYTPDWEKWWKNPDNVELFQFMGKDNVPFHTIMFPSTLLGTGEKWTMMKTISVTEYLNYEAGKFSKSKGIGVFGNDAKDTNIPPEVWRYYLLMNRPEVSDTLFTWADLQAKLNSELLNNLGNFINRVLSFVAKPAGAGYGSIVPDAPDADSHPLTKSLVAKTSKLVDQYLEAMEKVKLKQGLKCAMAISSEGNAYLQESQFWKLYKEDPAACAIVMKTSVGLVYLLACLLEPFMPSFSNEVLHQLNLPTEDLSFSEEKGETAKGKCPWDFVPAGHKIGKPAPLFKELKDDEVVAYRDKYAGSQAERSSKAAADAEANKVAKQLKDSKLSDGVPKKEQKKQSGGSKSKTADADVSVAKLDIRVGLIKKAEKHPDADSLYVEEIDVGEEAPRTVILCSHDAMQKQLLDDLVAAAKAAEVGNSIGAREILARLNQQLPPIGGKPFHRSASYLKEALLLALADGHSASNRLASPLDVALKLAAYKSISDLSPVLQFANFTATQALLDEIACTTASCVRVIDFDLAVGGQWSSFLQELAHRHGTRGVSLPMFKLTAFVSSASHHPLELHLTRDNLSQFADDLGIPFEFTAINLLDAFDPAELIAPTADEIVAVCLPVGCSVRAPPLPTLLQLVKQLAPKIVVAIDHGSDRGDLPFSQHFMNCFQSCMFLLDSIDAAGTDAEAASKIERFLIQPRVEDAVLGRRRAEKAMTWRSAFTSAGFAPMPLSNLAEAQADCILRRLQVRGFHVEKCGMGLALYWQRGELVSVSAWRC